MRQKTGGYFTVEAAMVLPMVLMVILISMYLFIYQYDRCLMEQDIGILAMRGAISEENDYQIRAQQIKKQAAQWYQEKYIAWKGENTEIKLEKGVVRVSQKGCIKFPFCSREINEKQSWEMETCFENHIISPVSFIRNYHKLTGKNSSSKQ